MTLPNHARTTLALLAAILLSASCSPAFDAPDTTDNRRSESLHQTPDRIDTPAQTTTCRDAAVELGVLRSEGWVACRLDLSNLSVGEHTFTQPSDFLDNAHVCAELLDLSLELYQSARGPALAWESHNARAIDALFVQSAHAGNLYTYRPTVEADEGVHAPQDGPSWAVISDLSFCVERALTLRISLVPGSVGPYDWHIEKSADPQILELGPDASGEVDYEVIVSATDVGPREIFVEGIAYITNTTDADAHIDNATIEVGGLSGDLDCGVNFPHTLQSQHGLECSYLVTGFDESVNESTVNAQLTVEVSDESPTRGGIAAQSTHVSLPPLDALDRVIVQDGDDLRAPCTFDAQPCVFAYTRTFECPFHQGTDEREARLTSPHQSATAPVQIVCADTHLEGQLLAQTFADASFQNLYVWNIEKSAAPEVLELGPNASADVTYSLNVSAQDSGESYYVVEGFIRVLNLTDFDAEISGISVRAGERQGTLNCDAPFPIIISAGANRVCSYTIQDIDPTETAVETRVEVTPTSVVGGVIAQGDISYNSGPTEPLETVQVRAIVDGLQILDEPCHWQAPCTFEYTRTFSCPLNEGAHFDSAYLPATGQRATARVDVLCEDAGFEGELRIQSAALTSYTRSYRWTIDASASHEQLLLQPGQTARVDYLAIITGLDDIDSDHVARGPVYITNPTEFDALIESVTTRAGDSPGSVDCGVAFPYLMAADSGLECTQTISNLSGNEPRSEVLVHVSPSSDVLGGISRWNLDWGPPTTHLFRNVTVRAEVEGVTQIEQSCSWDTGCTLEYSASFSSPHDEGPKVSTITIIEPGLEERVSVDIVCKGD